MCEHLTAEQKKECNGGTVCCCYQLPDLRPGADKGGHRERSLASSPQHRRHWNKEEKSKLTG